jgi:ketopantoate reductase
VRILIVGAGQVGYFLRERLSLEGHVVTLRGRLELFTVLVLFFPSFWRK